MAGGLDLLVLRHGRAEGRDPARYPDDGDRPLTDRGRVRIARQVAGMATIGVLPDAVVSSPLVRALETARIVAEGLDLRPGVAEMEELCPWADPRATLARLVAAHPPGSSVMVVGHEPHLSSLVSLVAAGSPGPIVRMRKGALCRLTVLPHAGGHSGWIEWSLTARQMIAMG